MRLAAEQDSDSAPIGMGEDEPGMMKLYHTPASNFVRKCTVTRGRPEDRVEIIPTKWPRS